ncbi:hypothetical protein D7V97_12940 [Corallococcus sp. CA053C]|uniref:hypothetical protein n=1 Tax=Corallococcus sp. CA053C TaxID=2316732 RepID=UPI000EA25E87|nr:hypothetical protein [Corallococcus sp. CA053C]RKH10766.1 hypothetical protein D7V97_12940 [Corallococcus sp. CA053C]
MLEVELDIFSGRPNPTWQLSEKEEKQLMDRVVAEPAQLSATSPSEEDFGLGYRGFVVRQIKQDNGPWSTTKRPTGVRFAAGLTAPRGLLPLEFRAGSKSGKGTSVADFLLKTSERRGSPATDVLREVVRGGVSRVPALKGPVEPPTRAKAAAALRTPKQIGVEGATWWACPSAYYNANAAIFNDPQYVTQNNCYCFASNHLANSRYALPGRRGGQPATSITCAGVTAGLRADGWVDTCQTNALTIAMVIWPGMDYHFYRVVTAGPAWWWGHKPGGTPARYTDNSGRALANGLAPSNCDRGPYTDFCGFFYQNNLTAFVA